MPFFDKTTLKRKSAELGIHFSKKRGQCFLIDRNIVNIIIMEAKLDPTRDRVLEIGSGLGTLSDDLISHSNRTYLIELDRKNAHFLHEDLSTKCKLKFVENNWADNVQKEQNWDVYLLHGDVLKVKWPSVNKIISNIPYQISGPILFKILDSWSSNHYDEVILMVQKEFAERLIAKESTPQYSRLSAAIGYFLNVELIRDVSNQCFYPSPKVTSSLIRISPSKNMKLDRVSPEVKKHYLKLLEGVFPYKGKSLRKALMLFFENFPEYQTKFAPLYQKVLPSEYSGFLTQKIRSISPEEFMKLVQFGLTGKAEFLSKKWE